LHKFKANIDKEHLIKCITEIIFGPEKNAKEREIFKNNLFDLIFLSYKAKFNKHIQYYLSDLFFGQETY
jgi:hypothetical protein